MQYGFLKRQEKIKINFYLLYFQVFEEVSCVVKGYFYYIFDIGTVPILFIKAH